MDLSGQNFKWILEIDYMGMTNCLFSLVI